MLAVIHILVTIAGLFPTLCRMQHRTPMTDFYYRRAEPADAALLYRLLQLYYFEQSHWSAEDIQPDGHYDACEEGIASYTQTTDPQGDIAYLLYARSDAALPYQLAGCVLTEPAADFGEGCRELADIFVLPKYRRQGICQQFVRQHVLAGGGRWLLAVFHQDLVAQRYWQRCLAQLPLQQLQRLADNERCQLFLLQG